MNFDQAMKLIEDAIEKVYGTECLDPDRIKPLEDAVRTVLAASPENVQAQPGPIERKPVDAHLAVVKDKDTGLHHGAIYHNHPTPSGCDRFLLAVTTKQGFPTSRAAAEFINASCPDITPIDLAKCAG